MTNQLSVINISAAFDQYNVHTDTADAIPCTVHAFDVYFDAYLYIIVYIANARMETASSLVQSDPGASIGAIGSILSPETFSEPLIPPSKLTKELSVLKKRKRSLSYVMTETPRPKDVQFNPLQVSYYSQQLRLSMNINTDDVYTIFSLF